MKIYLDNCCYNRPYDTQSQTRIALETQAKLTVQEAIRQDKYELVSSYMLDYENSENPYELRRTAIAKFIEDNASEYVSKDVKDKIEEIAKDIMDTGVKEKDAIHTACAIYSSCDYMLSTDIRLLKYKTDKIKLMNPVDFVYEMEENSEEGTNDGK